MFILTDKNFEEETKNTKPILVDFFANWCAPCRALAPVLEKLEKEWGKEIVFAKVDADAAPLLCQKYEINALPTIILLKEKQTLGAFTGLKSASEIQTWLKDFLEKELLKTYTDYAAKNGFQLNSNKEIVKTIIKGLLENEKKQGFRYCPCRRLSGNPVEDKLKICPCFWHQEEIKNNGRCHCGLFVALD